MSENAQRKQVLILGNGISRLLLAREIDEWAGEIWGCNRAYKEPKIGHRLTRLTGHVAVMDEAKTYRADHPELTFEIWGGHLGRCDGHSFTCPAQFRRDSGTTLVAQALHEGLDVVCAGMDMGGPDIHSPRLWTQRKISWVKRWREIMGFYGWDHVRFMGHDHMPFLTSGGSNDSYCNAYIRGIPHIPGASYRKLFDKQYKKHTGRECGRFCGYEPEQLVRFRFSGGGAVYVTHLRLSVAKILETKREGIILPPEVEIDKLVEEEQMVKVKFPNGYTTMMKESVARILVGRGTVELIEGTIPPKEEVQTSGLSVVSRPPAEQVTNETTTASVPAEPDPPAVEAAPAAEKPKRKRNTTKKGARSKG